MPALRPTLQPTNGGAERQNFYFASISFHCSRRRGRWGQARLALRSLVRSLRPWLAPSRVARSGETFNSVSFRLISSHFPSPEPSSSPSPRGDLCITHRGGSRSPSNGGVQRGDAPLPGAWGCPPQAYRAGGWKELRPPGTVMQRSPEGEGTCKGQGCEAPAFAETTAIGRDNDAYEQCRGWCCYGAMGSCRWFGVGAPKQGCEVPACAGITGLPHEV